MSAVSDELAQQVYLFDAILADIDATLRRATPADLDLVTALECRTTLGSASLALVRERLDSLLGEALGQYERVVPGFGMVRRSRPKSRSEWKSEDLLRMVLDTRRVDPDSGEIESDVDKLKHVYPLAGYQARRNALRERGIDPDEFCVVDVRPGWKIQTL